MPICIISVCHLVVCRQIRGDDESLFVTLLADPDAAADVVGAPLHQVVTQIESEWRISSTKCSITSRLGLERAVWRFTAAIHAM